MTNFDKLILFGGQTFVGYIAFYYRICNDGLWCRPLAVFKVTIFNDNGPWINHIDLKWNLTRQFKIECEKFWNPSLESL